ncbi:MAG: glycosyltransferase [Firmicutes bacterium]|nr:glycosyltransferase [Bacillota bacterium]
MAIAISAIIPFYNVEEKLIDQCIESVQGQTFSDYEIIIVNDGSKPEYAKVLQRIANQNEKIKVINQSNKGVSAARNTGVEYAEGDYITFIDADDLIMPDFFEDMYKVAIEKDAEYVVGGIFRTSDRNYRIGYDPKHRIEERDSKNIRSSLVVINEKLEDGSVFGRGPWGRLVKREIAKDVLFPENIKLGEDIIWNLKVVNQCKKVYLVYQSYYIYWINPDSATNKYNDQIVSICEQSLNDLSKLVDFDEDKEFAAYCTHIYEYLSTYVYSIYLGRKECRLSLVDRYRTFYNLLKHEPWSICQNKRYYRMGGKKERMMYLSVKLRMFFWIIPIRNRIKQKGGI